MHNKIRALLPSLWKVGCEQERRGKSVRGDADCEPTITQFDDYVKIQRGAGMHLQCICRHWVIIIIIIIIIYRLFTYVVTLPPLLWFLPFKPSSFLFYTQQRTATSLTAQRDWRWNACRSRMTNINENTHLQARNHLHVNKQRNQSYVWRLRPVERLAHTEQHLKKTKKEQE